MKRRSFLRALFGLPALPVVAQELIARSEIAAITPSNDELLRLARKHTAPNLEAFTAALNAQPPTWTVNTSRTMQFTISPMAPLRDRQTYTLGGGA